MSTSTNAILFYGVVFAEDTGFPWSYVNGEYSDIDHWWEIVNNYIEPEGLWPTDKQGNLLPGKTDKDYRAGREFRKEWKSKHPLPVELVTHCCGEYPMYGLACVGSVIEAYRGSPKSVDTVSSTPDASLLIEFCKKYNIKISGEPRWWLVSYWN